MLSERGIINLHHQKGLALLVFAITIVLAGATYVITNLSVNEIRMERVKSTQVTLKKAKKALIEYALIYGDIDGDGDGTADFPGEFGFLPCPDYNNGLDEGLEDNGNCGARSISKLGYYPWRTLGRLAMKDDNGTCLLYAVTGEYKNDEAAISNKSLMLNEDTNGMFQVVDASGAVIKGAAPQDRVVAIIFSPGSTIGAQVRTIDDTSRCGKDYLNMSAYLEGNGVTDNSVLLAAVDSVDQFIHATLTSEGETPPYNDRFVTITREELWSAILNRSDYDEKMKDLTQALAMCLFEYNNDAMNNRLPWPSSFIQADYRKDEYADLADTYAGRFPFKVDVSNIETSESVTNLFESIGCDNLVITISTSYLVNNVANYSVGETSIAVDNGTRRILAGDTVEFSGDLNIYDVVSKLHNGVISIDAPGLLQLLNDDTQVTVKRNIDLSAAANSEYRKLWKNWKDHFFYALSSHFKPAATPATDCAGDCITVDGNEVAGVVFFGGSREAGVTRNAPPVDADDDKANVSNYVENNNDTVLKAATGGSADVYVNSISDIMFCITGTLPFDVSEC